MSKRRVSQFVFMLLFGTFTMLNSIGNPRLAALHMPDFMKLISSGLCVGFGFGVLVGQRKFLGE